MTDKLLDFGEQGMYYSRINNVCNKERWHGSDRIG